MSGVALARWRRYVGHDGVDYERVWPTTMNASSAVPTLKAEELRGPPPPQLWFDNWIEAWRWCGLLWSIIARFIPHRRVVIVVVVVDPTMLIYCSNWNASQPPSLRPCGSMWRHYTTIHHGHVGWGLSLLVRPSSRHAVARASYTTCTADAFSFLGVENRETIRPFPFNLWMRQRWKKRLYLFLTNLISQRSENNPWTRLVT